jgi:hypothetical protein
MGPPHQPDPLGTFPERSKATASLFGTRLITDDEGSVHHCVPTMRGEVYRGFAEHDLRTAAHGGRVPETP